MDEGYTSNLEIVNTVNPKSADNPTIHADFASHPHLSSGF
jgi:nucleoside diphosphate kinase